MPIDSSIALGVKPVQIESPLNQMANVYALQNAQQSNQLNQMKMEEYKRGIANTERRNALLGGFAPDMSVDQQVNALARGGFLDEAKALAESSAKVSKDKRETEKAASDLKANSIKFHRDLLPTVRDQASYEQWGMNAIKDIPELGKMLPAQYDPALIPQLAMSADKYIEANKPQILQQNLGGKANIVSVNPYTGKQEIVSSSATTATPGELLTAATAKAGQAITVRGQNLTDARELKRIEIEQGKNSPEYIAMKSKMEEQGKIQAKFEAAAPQAITTAEQLLTSIDDLVGKPAIKDKATGKIIKEGTGAHKGFSAAVGAESMFPTMPGSNAADFEARLDQIKGGAFLESFEILRGGGSITEKEGDKGTAARMRMTLAQSQKEFIAAARDYQDVIRAGIKAAKEKLGKGNKTSPTTTPAGATVSNWHD
jgi:hypothetical protein